MTTPLPPIYRRRLLVHTEDRVRRFSRYHKYTVGTDLRQAAMAIMRTVAKNVWYAIQLAQFCPGHHNIFLITSERLQYEKNHCFYRIGFARHHRRSELSQLADSRALYLQWCRSHR